MVWGDCFQFVSIASGTSTTIAVLLETKHVPSHYEKQQWTILNWIVENKFQLYLCKNTTIIFIKTMHLKIPKYWPLCWHYNVLCYTCFVFSLACHWSVFLMHSPCKILCYSILGMLFLWYPGCPVILSVAAWLDIKPTPKPLHKTESLD